MLPTASVSPLSPEETGWWNIHTHRLEGDLRHVIWNCNGREDAALLCRRQEEGQAVPRYLSAGIHPWYTDETNFSRCWQWLVRMTESDKRVVAVGEAGMDRLRGASFEWQYAVLRKVAALADDCRLPLILHVVKAFNEVVELRKTMRPRNPWVVHGFRGGEELARCCLRQGICLSFGVQYRAGTLRIVPSDRLFMETDESDERMDSLYGRAAAVRGVSPEMLRRQVQENVENLFFAR